MAIAAVALSIGMAGASSTIAPSASAAPACTITWTGGGADENWATPENWNPVRVPDANDHVCLDDDHASVLHDHGDDSVKSIQSVGSVELTAGSLNLTDTDNDSSLAALTQSGGTLGGAALVVITNAYQWTGGAQAGPGTTRLAVGSATIVDAPGTNASLTGSRQLENFGALDWQAGAILVGDSTSLIRPSKIINAGGFAVSGTADGIYEVAPFEPTAEPSFENRLGATLDRSAVTMTPTTGLFLPLDNDGTVISHGGTILLAGGSGGAFSDGSFLSDGATSLVKFGGGEFDLGAAVLGGNVELESGTLSILDTAASSGTFTQSGGTVAGDGALAISGVFDWTGGTQGGNGQTTIGDHASATIDPGPGASVLIAGSRTLQNEGGLVWSSGHIGLGGNADVDNPPTLLNLGAIDAQGEGQIYLFGPSDATPLVLNPLNAVFTKTGGGPTTINVAFANGGTVSAVAGRIQFVGGDAGLAGQFASFGGGDAGTVEFALGDYGLFDASLDGNIDITGGTVDVTGTVNSSPDFLVRQTGGTVAGSGTLALNGEFDWSGGTHSGTGTTKLTDSHLPAAINGNVQIEGSRVFWNQGAVNWNAGHIGLGGNTDAGTPMPSIVNDGPFRALSDGSLYEYNLAAPSRFVNGVDGVLVKQGGAGETTVQIPFRNDGVVKAETGQIGLWSGDGGVPAKGSFGGGAGLVLFATGGYSLDGLGGADFAGNVVLQGGTVDATGSVPVDGSFTQSGGTLGGPGTVEIHDSFNWLGGVQTGSGTTSITGAATATVDTPGFTVSLSGARQLLNSGTLNWVSGSIGLTDAVDDTHAPKLLNLGLIDAKSDGFIFSSGLPGNAAFVNSGGTFKKSGGAGSTDILVPTENQAVLRADTGVINLWQGSSVSTGHFGGGAGDVRFFAGSFDLNNASFDGNVGLTGAAVDLEGTVNAVGNLTQTAGSVGGAGTLAVKDVFNWTGGSQIDDGDTDLAATATTTIGPTGGFDTVHLLGSRLLFNHGTVNWANGFIALGLANSESDGPELRNGGTINAAADGWLVSAGGIMTPVEVHNLAGGSFLKTGGDYTNSDLRFENDGVLKANTGAIHLFGGGGFDESTGSFGGGAGTVSFAGGVYDLGTSTFAGNVAVENGIVDVNATTTSVGALSQSGGSLQGPGLLSIGGAFTWTGGNHQGTGTTRVLPGAEATIAADTLSGSTVGVLESRLFENTGTLDWLSGHIAMGASGAALTGARIENTGFFSTESDSFLQDAGFSAVEPLVHNAAGAVFEKTAGSGESFVLVPFDNDGTVKASSGKTSFSNLVNLDGTTLERGRFEVKAGMGVQGFVTTNASDLVLDGPGSAVTTGSSDALSGFEHNAVPGHFTLKGGRNFDSSQFLNDGIVDVGGGSTFGTSELYSQNAGVTRLQAADSVLDPDGVTDVNVDGGTLAGIGLVDGDLEQAAGTISPGLSPGKLHGVGWNQLTGGELAVDIGGTTAGVDYDQFDLSGSVSLSSLTLKVTLQPGYVPSLGDRFVVVKGGSVTGALPTIDAPALGGGLKWAVEKTATTIELVVVQRTVSLADAQADEGDPVTFHLTVDPVSADPITVDYATADGTAHAPGDYTGVTSSVIIPANTAGVDIPVATVDDALDEADETFSSVDHRLGRRPGPQRHGRRDDHRRRPGAGALGRPDRGRTRATRAPSRRPSPPRSQRRAARRSPPTGPRRTTARRRRTTTSRRPAR